MYRNPKMMAMLFLLSLPLLRYLYSYAFSYVYFLTAIPLMVYFIYLKRVRFDFIVLLFFSLLFLISTFYTGNHFPLMGVYLSLATGVSVLVGYFVYLSDRCLVYRVAKMLVQLYVLCFLILGALYGYESDNINNYFAESSRNFVSAVAIFFQIFLNFSSKRAGKNYSLSLNILMFAICILSYGRSGITISGLILIGSFWLMDISNRKQISILVKVIFLIASTGLAFFFMNSVVDLVSDRTNFKQGLESARLEMIQEYASNMTYADLMLGLDFSGLPTIEKYGYNPHNSFINGHHFFGGVYLIYIVIIIFFIMFCYYPGKELYAMLMALFLLRGFFDTIMLPGYFDAIFYYMFFCFSERKRPLNVEQEKIKPVN